MSLSTWTDNCGVILGPGSARRLQLEISIVSFQSSDSSILLFFSNSTGIYALTQCMETSKGHANKKDFSLGNELTETMFAAVNLLVGACLGLLLDKALVSAYIRTNRMVCRAPVCLIDSQADSLFAPYPTPVDDRAIPGIGHLAAVIESVKFEGITTPYSRRPKKRGGYALLEKTLVNYKRLFGDLYVPQGFNVPSSGEWPEESWDMKLGTAVSSLRRGSYPSKRNRLLDMGFCFNVPEAKYDLAKLALLRYRKLHGNMNVIASFEVPVDSRDWPEHLWGLKLGMIVRNIRSGDSHADKRDDLISVGFTFDTTQARYEVAKTALLNYKRLHGDLLVPWKFEVPTKCQEWPKHTWGLNLGFIVGSMRRGSYADKHEELLELGFDFKRQLVRYGYQATKQALQYYHGLFGDMNVPTKFEVPSNNGNWPVNTRGMKLGYAVKDIKYGRIYADKKDDLIKMGFDFTIVRRKISFDTIMKVLLKYREVYGDLLVPQSFVVPCDDDDDEGEGVWPEEMWGLHIGAVVCRIRSGYYAEKKEELIKIGFTYCVRKKYSYDCFALAVAAFKSINGDSTAIPSKFKIDEGDLSYPENTRGMALGKYMQRVSQGSLWPDEAIHA